MNEFIIRIVFAAGIAAFLIGFGLNMYSSERSRAETAAACFNSGGKSLTRDWFGNVYCNK